MSTSTPKDAYGLLKSAIRDDDPVIFMESELAYGHKGEVPDEEFLIPLGQGEIKRDGAVRLRFTVEPGAQLYSFTIR